MKVAIVGTTSWGTTLGIMLAGRGYEVKLLAREAAEAVMLNQERENKARLPGFSFPPGLEATPYLEDLKGASLVIFAIPSHTLRLNARRVKDSLSPAALVMSATKGLEVETQKRMSQVLAEELGPSTLPRLCALSGPNLSREIAQGLPASSVVASVDSACAREGQEILNSPRFRVYTNTDLLGVELGGALKNIVALGAGMADEMGYGANAKAAFITRGLIEITRLGVAMGANPLTFYGLACLGDLLATCFSPLSRNRYVGQELAKGRALAEVTSTMVGVAEGVPTTRAARELARRHKVEMPITEETYKVLFEGEDPRRAIARLLGREARAELAGLER